MKLNQKTKNSTVKNKIGPLAVEMPNDDIQGMPIIRSGKENGEKGVKEEVIWLYYVDAAECPVGAKESVIFRCPGREHPCKKDDTTKWKRGPVIEVIKKMVHSSLELLSQPGYWQGQKINRSALSLHH